MDNLLPLSIWLPSISVSECRVTLCALSAGYDDRMKERLNVVQCFSHHHHSCSCSYFMHPMGLVSSHLVSCAR